MVKTSLSVSCSDFMTFQYKLFYTFSPKSETAEAWPNKRILIREKRLGEGVCESRDRLRHCTNHYLIRKKCQKMIEL